MAISSSSDSSTGFPIELIRFSSKVAASKAYRPSVPILLPEANAGQAFKVLAPNKSYEVSHYATPLMPLQERDMDALTGLFEREDITEIEADIQKVLLWLWPEPCWEEDPYEFLHEYL